MKPGDIVYLKSGGMPMTVRSCETLVYCDWHGTDGAPHGAAFLAVQITTTRPAEKS